MKMEPMTIDRVSKRLTALLQASGKTQAEIAHEAGYPRANIVAMMKMGVTKVPLKKAGALAKALDADPAHFTRLALETYAPETYDAIRGCLGELVSVNELEILTTIRRASKDGDPKITTELEERLTEIFRHPTSAGAGSAGRT